jgi:multiple sugar transport system ATP-binding protein
LAEIRLVEVTKKFDSNTAVDQISLTAADKEFVVLVGPSGCGKTTTLRMIAGLEEATEGNIYIGERKVNNVPPKDRDIAMVFQNYALYPHMSVFKNLAFGLKQRKYPKPEIGRRVKEVAELLGIQELLKRKPKELSGGQRQRVAMGRAIVRKPQLFLFDEPLSNLDAKLRIQVRGELARLHDRLETTVIYVTHDQVEAMTLADRIVVMHNGQIMQMGDPMEVYNNPGNLFVAGFIGSPAMNFFDVQLSEENGRLCVRSANFQLLVPDVLQKR